MLSRALACLVVAVLSVAATGCGLKGPLYSPDEGKETVGSDTAPATTTSKKRGPTMPPAPQAQKVPQGDGGAPAPSTSSPPPVAPPDPDRPADAEPTPPPDR